MPSNTLDTIVYEDFLGFYHLVSHALKDVILEESCPPLLLQDSEESGGGWD